MITTQWAGGRAAAGLWQRQRHGRSLQTAGLRTHHERPPSPDDSPDPQWERGSSDSHTACAGWHLEVAQLCPLAASWLAIIAVGRQTWTDTPVMTMCRPLAANDISSGRPGSELSAPVQRQPTTYTPRPQHDRSARAARPRHARNVQTVRAQHARDVDAARSLHAQHAPSSHHML